MHLFARAGSSPNWLLVSMDVCQHGETDAARASERYKRVFIDFSISAPEHT